MMKSKLVSSALSLAILCSASVVNAETVVGQVVAKPSATINANVSPLQVGDSATAYIEGDSVTTNGDASAIINLTSGVARIVIAPHTVMSVVDAENASLSLTQGAISVNAEMGRSVVITTSVGSFELVSDKAVDAVVAFEAGELSILPKSGTLVVTADDGLVVSSIDAGNAFISNGRVARSVDVQLGGTAGGSSLNTALIIGGIVIGTAVASDQLSDGDEAGDASPQ